MHPDLQSLLLQRADIWRAKTGIATPRAALPSGSAELDRALHGGWPSGALTELLLEQNGIGELRLLMPLFAAREQDGQALQQAQQQVSHQTQQQAPQQVWIDPPLQPYAPALRQCGVALADIVIVRPPDREQWLWACVQALRVGRQVAVLCWSNRHRLRYADLRQLQVAANEHGSQGFLLRDLASDRRILQHSTPAPLRLHLRADAAALHIEVLKQRGSAAGQQIALPHPRALQKPVQSQVRAAIAPPLPKPRAPRPVVPRIDTVNRKTRWL
jgi:protein ImuA